MSIHTVLRSHSKTQNRHCHCYFQLIIFFTQRSPFMSTSNGRDCPERRQVNNQTRLRLGAQIKGETLSFVHALFPFPWACATSTPPPGDNRASLLRHLPLLWQQTNDAQHERVDGNGSPLGASPRGTNSTQALGNQRLLKSSQVKSYLFLWHKRGLSTNGLKVRHVPTV